MKFSSVFCSIDSFVQMDLFNFHQFQSVSVELTWNPSGQSTWRRGSPISPKKGSRILFSMRWSGSTRSASKTEEITSPQMSLGHGWVGGLLIYGGLREKPLKIMTKKCGFPCLPLAAGSRRTPQDFDEEMWVPCLPLAMLGHGGKDKRGPSRLCRRIGDMVVAGNVGPGPPK